ncbi:MAG: glycosyltransferase [Xanthobacteraceae bacterium]
MAILAQQVDAVIAVDNGSKDRTAERARAAGAQVVLQPERGYGRACAAGLAAVPSHIDIVCYMDGDGSDVPSFIPVVARPIAENTADGYGIACAHARAGQHDRAADRRRPAGRGSSAPRLRVSLHDMSPFRDAAPDR